MMAATYLILFVTHLLGGVAAFGSALLALPMLLLAGWDVRSAVALLLIVGVAQAVAMVGLTWRALDRRVLFRILVLAGIGLPVGFLAAARLPERGLGFCLGVLLMAAGASRLLEHGTRAAWRPPAWLLDLLVLIGGVVHGAFGTGGATLTIVGRFALRDKAAFRATLSALWVVLNSVVIAGLLKGGHVGRTVYEVLLPGTLVVLMATALGNGLAKRVSPSRFADLVGILLALAGIMTVARNMDWGMG